MTIMTTIFDFKQAALDLATATDRLSNKIYKLDYLHILNHAEVIDSIRAEQYSVYVLRKKIRNMRDAEDLMQLMTDDLYEEIVEWLYEQGISTFDSQSREDNVFLAVENGWEMYPEPADSFGEPPMTMSEMHENARKEKMEAWAK